MRQPDLPDLGVGLVWWEECASFLQSCVGTITAIEIEPEAFCVPTSNGGCRIDPRRMSSLLAIDRPKLVHSVGFPVGGTVEPDARGLGVLRTIVESFQAPWASLHLSFNQVYGGSHAGFLLPPLQVEEGVALAARNLRNAERALGVPVAFETGVNYLRPVPGEMSDGAFVAAVATAADCGILLDLHNIWVNEKNGRQRVEDFLAEIPLERVWEIHVGGGECLDGYWLDAHSRLAPDEILRLAEQVAPWLQNLKAIMFEILPVHASSLKAGEVMRQMESLQNAWSQRATKVPRPRACRNVSSVCDADAARWEAVLFDLIHEKGSADPLASVLSEDDGLRLYARLIREARSGAIVEAAKLTSRGLLLQSPDLMNSLLREHFRVSDPELFAASEAIGFLAFALPYLDQYPVLADVATFEHALLRTMVTGGRETIVFRGNPLVVVEALSKRRAPPETGVQSVSLVIEKGAVTGVTT